MRTFLLIISLILPQLIQATPPPSTSTTTSTTSPSTSSPYHYISPALSTSTSTPSFYKSSLSTLLSTKWSNAHALALLEQTVEDYNAEIVATAPDYISSISYRRLIVLPLDERFDPPMGMFSHGHVQTGDKMSLPGLFWGAIVKSGAEVPWLFELSRVEGVTSPRVPNHPETSSSSTANKKKTTNTKLTKVVGGAIDFRSPSNYIFLPHWMMKSLSLHPFSVVDVKLSTTTPPGSAVKLRPHSSEFTKIQNHRAVLETELRHYSALVAGSTIPFDYLGKRYYFDVVELRSAPRGEKVSMAKVQDCDIAAEFVKAKDLLGNKKEKQKKQQQQNEESDDEEEE